MISDKPKEKVYFQLAPEELVDVTIQKKEGQLTNTGSLAINIGKFTGRSPKDRFIVKDELTREKGNSGAAGFLRQLVEEFDMESLKQPQQ